jgi:hypothetical protein
VGNIAKAAKAAAMTIRTVFLMQTPC